MFETLMLHSSPVSMKANMKALEKWHGSVRKNKKGEMGMSAEG